MKTILVDAVYCFLVKGDDGQFGVFKEMHDMLETFPNQKILLTGARDEEIKGYGLDNVPYEYFTLKLNPPKKDPKYFELMRKHYGFGLADVIYFEHNLGAAESARKAGITTYHYDNVQKDLAALKSFIKENL